MDEKWIECCSLCNRNCLADRSRGQGRCRTMIKKENGKWMIPVARAALHFWEEPCLSGKEGSGAVFFSGCNLCCIFCQNSAISGGLSGKWIDIERLVDIFFELKEKGANNINLVTAGHVLPFVREAVIIARKRGLLLPVIYNTGGYETVEAIKSLEGIVDIYLPDMKYMSPALAKRYSGAEDYPKTALSAITEMVRQTKKPVFDERGMMLSGTIVRHLVLPGSIMDSKRVIKGLYDSFKDDIYISIMNQYTPMEAVKDHPQLKRRVSAMEYKKIVDYAIELGVENGFTQEAESASESFIPQFDNTGV